jgi:hypothetical protein
VCYLERFIIFSFGGLELLTLPHLQLVHLRDDRDILNDKGFIINLLFEF